MPSLGTEEDAALIRSMPPGTRVRYHSGVRRYQPVVVLPVPPQFGQVLVEFEDDDGYRAWVYPANLDRMERVCQGHAYWWEGEYEGDCCLQLRHTGDHFDGLSWFNNNNEDTGHLHGADEED
jgi:hypothetical protein